MSISYRFQSLAEMAAHFADLAKHARSRNGSLANKSEAAAFEAAANVISKSVIEPEPKEDINKYQGPWTVERQGSGTTNETLLVRSATGWAICVMRENGPQAEAIANAIAGLVGGLALSIPTEADVIPQRPTPPPGWNDPNSDTYEGEDQVIWWTAQMDAWDARYGNKTK